MRHETALVLAAEAADVLDRAGAREATAQLIEEISAAGYEGLGFIGPARRAQVHLLALAEVVELTTAGLWRLTERARQRLELTATATAVH